MINIDPNWLTLFWDIATTLVQVGILSKDKLPKDFPKTSEELEDFILKVSLKNADKILAENYEVVDEWDD